MQRDAVLGTLSLSSTGTPDRVPGAATLQANGEPMMMLNADIGEQDVREALARLLRSPDFRTSERNKRFLRYAVEETLAGRGARIKSYAIAIDVFERGADFDGAADSIVRTEATRIRSALTCYYSGEGSEDCIRISLPAGGYVARFERLRMAEAEPEDVEECVPPSPALAAMTQSPRRWFDRLRVLAYTAAIAGLAPLLLLVGRTELSSAGTSPKATIVMAVTQQIRENAPTLSVADGIARSVVLSLTRDSGVSVAIADERQPVDAIVSRQSAHGAKVYVLESSLEIDEARLRFRWRLVDAADQTVLLADQVDQPVNEASTFDVEDKIAAGVAREIAAQGGLFALNQH
jgi:adenylate cyclase